MIQIMIELPENWNERLREIAEFDGRSKRKQIVQLLMPAIAAREKEIARENETINPGKIKNDIIQKITEEEANAEQLSLDDLPDNVQNNISRKIAYNELKGNGIKIEMYIDLQSARDFIVIERDTSISIFESKIARDVFSGGYARNEY